jgi:hypothetical protein
MDVAVTSFVTEWAGMKNALQESKRRLEYYEGVNNPKLIKRYEEIIVWLEEKIREKDEGRHSGLERSRS